MPRGQTALHKAVENQHRKICYMLVAAGANLNMRDANGQTPMMLAFQADDHDLAAYLESMWRPLSHSINSLTRRKIIPFPFTIPGQEKMLRTEFTEDI